MAAVLLQQHCCDDEDDENDDDDEAILQQLSFTEDKVMAKHIMEVRIMVMCIKAEHIKAEHIMVKHIKVEEEYIGAVDKVIIHKELIEDIGVVNNLMEDILVEDIAEGILMGIVLVDIVLTFEAVEEDINLVGNIDSATFLRYKLLYKNFC